MKKGLKKGLSLFVVGLMLTSLVPVNVFAENTIANNETVVQQENISANNSENGLTTIDQTKTRNSSKPRNNQYT